ARGAIQETFWALRRLLETLAGEQPLVAVIDDIHWAEPTLLDLIEYVAGFSRGHPLLLLCTARPELREDRPDWGRAGATVALQPLGETEAEELVENLLGHTSLPAEVRARVVESAEGNPLFVEEMLRMLIDDGLLRRDDGHWIPTGDLSRVSTPRTIQALIAARLDRLEDEERAVIQRASVVGKVFYWGAVTELSPEDVRGTVGSNLQTLLRKELILPEPSSFAGEDAFRFSHILVHDAAYASMPKRTRAELHERFAAWLERSSDPRASEFEEILGYHFEQAYRYLAELGPVDDRARAVASKAAERLAAAGQRAFALGDMPAAAGLLTRATNLLPEREPSRVALLPELGAVLTETGAWNEAEEVLAKGIEEARLIGDRRSEARAVVKSIWIGEHSGHFASNLDPLPELERALAMSEDLGDDRGLADGWALFSNLQFWIGRADRAVEALDRAIDYARRARDRRREFEALSARVSAELWGATPADVVARSLQELTENAPSDPLLRSSIARMWAVLEGMRGNFDRAREHVEAAMSSAREFGLEVDYAAAVNIGGFVSMLAGDPERASRELAEGVGIYRAMGNVGHLASYAPALADALYAQGRYEEGLALTEEAEGVSIEGDLDAHVHWRRVRAKILARQGKSDEAVRIATEAADMARTTDDFDKRGKALMDLAEVLQIIGRSPEAVPVLREAMDTFDHKGNVVMTAVARGRLQELVPST
ncbi:MAG: ATP-binding protein, partial [Actinomycetota bacterium]